jgi:hypothetical protein
MNDDLSEPATSRRAFLRKLGSTLAVGIGAAAVAPALARGATSRRFVAYVCCPNNTGAHGCTICGGDQTAYWCYSTECQNGFCLPCRGNSGCFDDVLPGCV